MSQIILDFGSGNTCRNDWDYVKRMIDELKAVDTGKHEVIIKWQLFKKAGDNIPLEPKIFEAAYIYAQQLGYKTTSSVFDKESLDFLLQFEVPFIKLANRRDLDWLIGEVPRKVPIYVSYDNIKDIKFRHNIQELLCISNYPAKLDDYELVFNLKYDIDESGFGISDHTSNLDLWNKYKPGICEMHYGLPDSTGLDAGPFMRTPAILREVL